MIQHYPNPIRNPGLSPRIEVEEGNKQVEGVSGGLAYS